MRLAVVNAIGQVVTFVRPDTPMGWKPPDGCNAVPENELQDGWKFAPDESPVPEAVTARQARLWLIRNGITLAQVDAVIAAIPDAMTRQTVQIDWEYSTEVRRASPFVEQLAQALGLDDAALDMAFRESANI